MAPDAGTISEETPKKVGRPKKTKTPGDGDGDGTGTGPQQENGTPRRKYTRKETTRGPDPADQEAPGEPEEETPARGRPRRGAAKA